MPNKTTRDLLIQFSEAKNTLRERGVIRSERFTGELGEWLVETAHRGQRAKGTTQKGWDIKLGCDGNSTRLQVKAHAKGNNNPARWTNISPDSLEHFDRLVIVVMTSDYYIKEWLEIPVGDVRQLIVQSGKSTIIKWDDARRFTQDWKSLPGAQDISDFEMPG
jgi:hypothetical protein